MTIMTMQRLREILAKCAGEAEHDAAAGDFARASFQDLGYDSLALMETASRIEHEYGVPVSDEEISELRTPQELLDLVNGAAVREA